MNINTLIGTGLGLGLGFGFGQYRTQIIGSTLRSAIWLVDQYVELKWYYLGEPEIGQSIIQQEHEEQCAVIQATATHIIYSYRDNCYITPDTVPPKIYELDQVYDDEERISEIKLYRNGQPLDPPDERLTRTLVAFAGPLCDFHGKIPSINDIKKHISGPLSELICDKIIVLTANFKEYVILPPQSLENTQGTY